MIQYYLDMIVAKSIVDSSNALLSRLTLIEIVGRAARNYRWINDIQGEILTSQLAQLLSIELLRVG